MLLKIKTNDGVLGVYKKKHQQHTHIGKAYNDRRHPRYNQHFFE